ncbi:MAG: hypothetical protein V4635_07060 [Bacteroidota bacterium]
MQRVFIIRLILFFSGITCYGQFSLNDSLLFYEYRYFKCSDATEKQNILLKKIDLYLNAGITNSLVFNEIKRVNIGRLASGQNEFLWNAALISYLNIENDQARFFLKEYEISAKDSSVMVKLLKVLLYKDIDTSISHVSIAQLSEKDPLFKGLTCFDDIISYNRKHLNFYLFSSAIVPGSGSAMNGYVLKGLLSLAITSASAYAIVKMVEYGLYVNAVLWGTGVGLKFYAGNISLTEKLFYKAEAKQKNKLTTGCELTLKSILDKYPLTLRLK